MNSIFIFISGAVLLIFSAEKLVGYLVGIASRLQISVFLLAIIFTGIEFDDIFLGVALNLEDLDGVALGIVFGTALSLPGVVLALAAILTPTKVNMPRKYLVLFAVAPLIMVVFTLMAPLNAADGIILVALFVLFLAYVAVQESRGETPVFRDAEMYEAYAAVREGGQGTPSARGTLTTERPANTDFLSGGTGGTGGTGAGKEFARDMPFAEARKHSGPAGLALAILAVVGLVIGAATAGIGTAGILDDFHLAGTLFGATIATLVLTIEDIFLTVEPARKGAPEIGVGNVIGSVIFSVTGKLGIILLAGGIVIGPNVLTWHLPALIVMTGLSAYFLYTGELKRWHGFVLLGLYVVYWIVCFTVLGTVPVDVD